MTTLAGSGYRHARAPLGQSQAEAALATPRLTLGLSVQASPRSHPCAAACLGLGHALEVVRRAPPPKLHRWSSPAADQSEATPSHSPPATLAGQPGSGANGQGRSAASERGESAEPDLTGGAARHSRGVRATHAQPAAAPTLQSVLYQLCRHRRCRV